MIELPPPIEAYKVAELITLTRCGSPICWPMAPYFGDGKIAFATGYVSPGHAHHGMHVNEHARPCAERAAVEARETLIQAADVGKVGRERDRNI